MKTLAKVSFAVTCLGVAAADAFSNGMLPEPLVPFEAAAIAAVASLAGGAMLAAVLIHRHARAVS